MQAARPFSRYRQIQAHVQAWAVPSWLLVIAAILGFQLSSVLAKPVIEEVGAIQAIFLRTAIGAGLLVLWRRPRLPRSPDVRRSLVATGALMIGSNGFIYAAFDHIPVAVAVAIQFIGPIGVAVLHSHRPLDVVWALLAAVGILLFTPLTDVAFAPIGLTFAVISGLGFGVYLIVAGRLMTSLPPGEALALTLAVAAVAVAPLAVAQDPGAMLDPEILLRSVAVSVTANVIGFSLEFAALGRIRPALYGILICLEPAVAAILAVPLLGERLGPVSIAAIGLVTLASIGASRSR